VKRLGVLTALALLAAGCALTQGNYRLVEPGVRSMDETDRVYSRLAWSSAAEGKIETWTVDGFSLESLKFYEGIADSETMLPNRANDITAARFRASMTPLESVEFVVDSLYGSPFTPRSVRPAHFGRADGFRFEVSYWRGDGVKREALVTGATVKGRLHVIIYEGTALYHFERYRPDVERLLESIALIDS
jgi:hypothetical protein